MLTLKEGITNTANLKEDLNGCIVDFKNLLA